MKRKLALLLAAVMTLSLLPTMGAFASTTNRLSKSPTVIPGATLLPEEGTWPFDNPDPNEKYKSEELDLNYNSHDDIDYVVDGTDLILTVRDNVKVGDEIRLELENAKWFFRNPGDQNWGGEYPATYDTRKGEWDGDSSKVGNYERFGQDGQDAYDDYVDDLAAFVQDQDWADDDTVGDWSTTDGAAFLVYYNDSVDADDEEATAAEALAVASPAKILELLADLRSAGVALTDTIPVLELKGTEQKPLEIPYVLTVSNLTDSVATVKILPSYDVQDVYQQADFWEIRIPLVSRTTDEGTVRVRITDSNLSSVSTGTYGYANTSDSLTKTYVDDPITARNDWTTGMVVIKESRISSIPTSGKFQLALPSAFEWVIAGSGTSAYEAGDNFDPDIHTYLDVENGLKKGAGWTYSISYKNQGTDAENRSIVEVEYSGLNVSRNIAGALFIPNLNITAEDNAPVGDIFMTIKSLENDCVTNESKIIAGTKAEWDIILTTKGDIPTLVNGRYDKEDPLDAEDDVHQTATIVFRENTENAWWAGRMTIFTLPEGVKWRKVEFDTVDEIAQEDAFFAGYTSKLRFGSANELINNDTGTLSSGVFVNDNQKHGYLTINGNTMTLSNLRVNTGEKAEIIFDAWISIESGFEGDVKLTVTGSGIPAQSNGGEVPATVIAKAVSPITVETKITDIKTGYQYQTTADIIIKETKAGMLEKSKTALISVSDMITNDLAFSNDTKLAVTGGNLKIKDVNNFATFSGSVATGTTALLGSGGTLSFNVATASSEASTITLSNVAVKVDRAVPYTNNRPYKAVVWGEAVAPNYTYFHYNAAARDKFNTPGIVQDYLKVVTSADDRSSVLTQKVAVTIGERYFTVNGETYDMDAAAYISTASNSTMVPVRFISNAFGIRDDQVIWDDANRTVTIITPSKVIQFKIGSDIMRIDSTDVTMYSPDRLPVAAEITGERAYVPFRAMGEAFGVAVAWNDSTRTAIYNPEASDLEPAAVEEPAEEPAE